MTINSHQQTSIKLLSECFVKPKHEIDAAKQIYHLGPIDLTFLNIDPIQKGVLYTLNKTSSHDIKPSSRERDVCNLLHKLKHSLSIALVHFYPLGGRFSTLSYPDEGASSVFVDCNKGPGARFIHATAPGLAVSDVLSPVDVTLAHPFFDLGERYANYDGHTKALLSIQVTELRDGVFIGFSMNHSVVDGTTFIHFVDMLSEIYRMSDYGSENDEIVPISRVPVFDYRPWLSDNEDARIMLKLPYSDPEKCIARGYDPGPLRERIFHFSPASMASLKAKANQESGAPIIISSFQALTALVWRCITRARSLPVDQEATCFFAIGARGRFDPPAPDDYFGNFISKAQWACKVEELLSNELGWAALNLRHLVATQDTKEVLGLFQEYANSPCLMPRDADAETDFHGSNSVIMGGSARFDMYGPQFGLGRALAARMGFGNKQDGKVTAAQGCEGNGSVDLEICLRPQKMTVLETDEEFMSFVSLN